MFVVIVCPLIAQLFLQPLNQYRWIAFRPVKQNVAFPRFLQ
jgi:hypothetical protein